MYEHEKRAWRLVQKRLRERGLAATHEQQVEIVGFALQRESFLYCLDACVEWAIGVVMSPKSSAA